jgi:prepilin-type N-terminal cleavage/methylation domain-containing protein
MKQQQGFTMTELLVGVAIFAIIMTSGHMVLLTSQATWATTDTQIQLQENARQTLLRISKELQESGEDKDNVLQISIGDNTGTDGTDTIRFAVPLCVCGELIDNNGDVAHWGAPVRWGANGCGNNIVLEDNGKVKICHLPPGNPDNEQDIEVGPTAVPAHLAHGDWVGACAPCDPGNNRYIEYRIDNNGQLLRRVLDGAAAIVQETVFAQNITDFQASLDAGQDIMTLTVRLAANSDLNRPLDLSRSVDIVLRNK